MKNKLIKSRKYIIAFIAIVAIYVTVSGYINADKYDEITTMQREYTATVDDITVGIESSGNIDTVPNNHTFPEQSFVETLYVKVGSEVKIGDELAKISISDLDELIKKTNDELSDANAALSQANTTRDLYLKQSQNSQTGIVEDSDRIYYEKISKLDNDLVTINSNLSAYQTELNNTNDKIAILSPEAEKINLEITRLKNTINENIIEIGRLQAELLGKNSSSGEKQADNKIIDQLQSELVALNDALSTLINQASLNQGTIDSLQETINANLLKIQAFEDSITEDMTLEETLLIEQEIVKLSEINKTKTTEIDTISFKNEIANKKLEIETIKKKISSIQDDVSSGDETDSINKKIQLLQNENIQLQQELDNLLKDQTIANLEKATLEKDTVIGKINAETKLKTDKSTEIEKAKSDRAYELSQRKKDLDFADYKSTQEVKAMNENVVKAQREVTAKAKILEEFKELKESPILYAKNDGVVSTVNYAEGEQIFDGKPLLTIGELSDITMKIPVDAFDIGGIEINQKVKIYVEAFAEQEFSGYVSERLLVANDNGEFEVIITIDPTDAFILPGMKAYANIIVKDKPDVLTLSNKAIFIEDGKQCVTLKNEDGTTSKTEIITGFSDGRVSEILSGLSENDVVVVEE